MNQNLLSNQHSHSLGYRHKQLTKIAMHNATYQMVVQGPKGNGLVSTILAVKIFADNL